MFTSRKDKMKSLCHKNTQPKRSNSLHSKIARIAHFCPLLPTKPTITFIFAPRTRTVQMLTFVPLGTRSLALENSFQQLSSNPPSTFVGKISSSNEQHSYPTLSYLVLIKIILKYLVLMKIILKYQRSPSSRPPYSSQLAPA